MCQLNRELFELWRAWRKTPKPIVNFRSGSRLSPSYDQEFVSSLMEGRANFFYSTNLSRPCFSLPSSTAFLFRPRFCGRNTLPNRASNSATNVSSPRTESRAVAARMALSSLGRSSAASHSAQSLTDPMIGNPGSSSGSVYPWVCARALDHP